MEPGQFLFFCLFCTDKWNFYSHYRFFKRSLEPQSAGWMNLTIMCYQSQERKQCFYSALRGITEINTTGLQTCLFNCLSVHSLLGMILQALSALKSLWKPSCLVIEETMSCNSSSDFLLFQQQLMFIYLSVNNWQLPMKRHFCLNQ